MTGVVLDYALHKGDPGYEADRSRVRRQRARDYLAKIKVERGCVDCGYNAHSAALDFDHVRGVKRFNLGHAGRAHGWQAMLDEIEKCEIVCANCHRVRTSQRRNSE